jgi:biotin carboxyl carrier protein
VARTSGKIGVRYFATAAGREREVELSEEGVRLDGRSVHAELARLPGGHEGHVRLGDRGYSFSARRVDDGWEIQIAGRRIVVRVEDERTRAIRELAGQAAGPVAARDLRAPMPGLVARVLVEPGQTVHEGTGLVIVEAMKMENELMATAPGRVATVEVAEGDTVNQSDLLVTFEREEE